MNFFECKVSHDQVEETTGKKKKITDTYLVDALSFSEAEARINEEVAPFYNVGEFTVAGIRKARISEIFGKDIDASKWYKCKVSYVTIDEVSAKEKRFNYTILVHADDFDEALKNLKEGLKDTISDTEIVAISDTPIMDIFLYAVPEN
ncbi:MAG: DUF4494 domain-containing protein [Paludibacteraceae bacterium]|jgi:hypothetical protein|nr:DUF4494 domain-containing protein [Paludibacteraceae bacterium]MBR2261220.1 DUF4494 domain-containing protein [Paludibacteraceae bacterium]MEE3484766.1 DUF4494 domain-containing protein [Bacteroidales bacterium]